MFHISNSYSSIPAAQLVFLLLSGLCLSQVVAVRTGDEQYGLEQNGLFYVFLSGQVQLIDPVTLSSVKTINDSDLPANWGDSVYSDNGPNQHFLFAVDRTYSRMIVFDTVAQEIIARIPMGLNPVHVYTLEHLGQIWSHSDGEGNFDVIDYRKNVCSTFQENLGRANSKAHGKLLFDDDLAGIAFATNTADSGIFRFNLTDYSGANGTFVNFTQLAQDNLGSLSTCGGTHGIAYSSVNKHLYVECSGGSKGTWEYDTVGQQLIAIYPSALGQLYSTPDDEFIAAVNGAGNTVHLFQAVSNGVSSNQTANFNVTKPSRPAFTPVNSSTQSFNGQFEDWIGWFSSSSTVTGAGLAYVDFATVVAAGLTGVNATLVDSGTVNVSTRYVEAGGPFVALNSDFPSKSLAIVNVTSKTLIGHVPFNTNATFFRVSWVPTRLTTNLTSCLVPPPISTNSPTTNPTSAPTSSPGKTNAAASDVRNWLGLVALVSSLIIVVLM